MRRVGGASSRPPEVSYEVPARPRVAVACAAAVLALPVGSAAAGEISWPSGGHDISNTHSQPAESTIHPSNVGRLAPKWTAQLHGDVSAVPAGVGGAGYVAPWGGVLKKKGAQNGARPWGRASDSHEGPRGAGT